MKKLAIFLTVAIVAGCDCDDSSDSCSCADLYVEDVPSFVSDIAVEYTLEYDVQPAVFLAIAWHERAGVYGWRDDFIFGYGAYDNGNSNTWPSKFAGWETQWDNAAPKIGQFFSENEPSSESFQRFARNIYKTTAWQSYRTAYKHYLRFKKKTYLDCGDDSTVEVSS
jgi:hypothetical protein